MKDPVNLAGISVILSGISFIKTPYECASLIKRIPLDFFVNHRTIVHHAYLPTKKRVLLLGKKGLSHLVYCMENSTLNIVIFFVGLVFFLVYIVLGTIQQRRANLHKLVHEIFRIVSQEVKNATAVHHTPARDGPSYAIHRYTSPQFTCEVGVPHHHVDAGTEDTEPSPLVYIEGFLGDISTEMCCAIRSAFPALRNGSITQIHYGFSMSNENEQDVRVQRGLEVQLEIGNGSTEKIKSSFCFVGKEISDGAIDTLFRNISRQ